MRSTKRAGPLGAQAYSETWLGAAHWLAVVVIDEARNFEKAEGHPHPDLGRLEEADRHSGRQNETDLQLPRLRAFDHLCSINCSQPRVAFKAHADGQHRGFRSLGDDLRNDADDGDPIGVLIDGAY